MVARHFQHSVAADLVMELAAIVHVVDVKGVDHIHFLGVKSTCDVWVVQSVDASGALESYVVHGATSKNGAALMVMMHRGVLPGTWEAMELDPKESAKQRHDMNQVLAYEQVMRDCDEVDARKAAAMES